MCGAAGRRRRQTRIYTFCCPGRSSGRRRTPIPRPLDRIYVGPVLTVSPGPLGTLCCTGLMGAKEIDYVLVGTLVHLFPLVAPLLITAAKKKERKRHPPGKSESIIIKSSFVLFSKRHPASVVVSSLDGIITRYCDHQVCAPSRSDALSLYI